MNADRGQSGGNLPLLHADVTNRILKTFYEVYNELGGGFLESVYQRASALALGQGGLRVNTEVPVPVYFRRVAVGDDRADLVVEDFVPLELKAVSNLDEAHTGQLLHYLRATDFEVGFLFNFGPRPQFKRMILENASKKLRVYPRSSPWGEQSDEHEDWFRLRLARVQGRRAIDDWRVTN